MKEYGVSIICTAALIVLGLAVCYKENCKITKAAFSLILSAAVILPIAPMAKELLSGNAALPDMPDFNYGEEYKDTAREALEDGIAEALCVRFGIDKENIEVSISEFDFEKMSCGKINTRLFGAASFSNITEIKKYISENFKGSDVRVEIGQY